MKLQLKIANESVLDGVLSLSDKHKFELLDTGVVVSGHKVSVSHDQSAVEDIIGGVMLVQDVLDVVHGVGLMGRRLVNVGRGGVQVLKQLSKGALRNRFLGVFFGMFVVSLQGIEVEEGWHLRHGWHTECFARDANAEVSALGIVGTGHIDVTVADISSVVDVAMNDSWAVGGAWVSDVEAAGVAVHEKGLHLYVLFKFNND